MSLLFSVHLNDNVVPLPCCFSARHAAPRHIHLTLNRFALSLLRSHSATPTFSYFAITDDKNCRRHQVQGRQRMATSNEEKQLKTDDGLALLDSLRNHILEQLDHAVPNDCIQLCKLSTLAIIADRPEDVLEKAKEQLHAYPYEKVPTHWRRLYEDASLHLAAKLLKERITQLQKFASPTASFATFNPAKRQKLDRDIPRTNDWLAEFCNVVDRAVIISGAPGRKHLIDDTLKHLEVFVKSEWTDAPPRRLLTPRPPPLDTPYAILRTPRSWDFEEFQLHLDTTGSPVIIPDTFEHWPARTHWDDINYLLYKTLGGKRVVPVEIGSSYTEANWTQKIMPFGAFVENYLLAPCQQEQEEQQEQEPSPPIGYLAQHNLFTQIPSLQSDISTPDYCYTTPPPTNPSFSTTKTSTIQQPQPLDSPLLNAWLGPPGTKTPLHTDPHHNILCQVVGYKYIRLYNPLWTKYLYPAGVDAAGVDMGNTSLVDVKVWRGDVDEEEKKKFPEFGKAEYLEAVLGPGECLYIPLGWWHYVESLTASFSVSFWWN